MGVMSAEAMAWQENHDSHTLNCTTPPMPIAELVSIQARLNDEQRAAESVPFRFYDMPEVR